MGRHRWGRSGHGLKGELAAPEPRPGSQPRAPRSETAERHLPAPSPPSHRPVTPAGRGHREPGLEFSNSTLAPAGHTGRDVPPGAHQRRERWGRTAQRTRSPRAGSDRQPCHLPTSRATGPRPPSRAGSGRGHPRQAPLWAAAPEDSVGSVPLAPPAGPLLTRVSRGLPAEPTQHDCYCLPVPPAPSLALPREGPWEGSSWLPLAGHASTHRSGRPSA